MKARLIFLEIIKHFYLIQYMNCIFCSIANANIPKHEIVWKNGMHIAFTDAHPVTIGHTLLIPKQHAESLEELSETEHTALFQSVRQVSTLLKEQYACNKMGLVVEGTSVAHLHIHLIPLQQGETINGLVNKKH